MPQGIRVAVVQMAPVLGNADQNLTTIEKLATQAAGQGADIVAFPECALQGFVFASPEEATLRAVDRNGTHVSGIARIAQQLTIVVIVGFLERIARGIANTAIVAFPDGHKAFYTKTHLTRLGADRWADPGASLSDIFEFRGLNFGLAICYDLRFPEVARVLTLNGAEAIIVPANSPVQYEALYDHGARTRAWENRVWVVLANRCGSEGDATFVGRSLVADPYGNVVVNIAGDEPGIVFADLDPMAARAKHLPGHDGETYDFFEARRPELYARLSRIHTARAVNPWEGGAS